MGSANRKRNRLKLGGKDWLGIVILGALLMAAAVLGTILGIVDKD